MTTEKSHLILLGTIGAAHGIKGQVRIAAHTQDPEAIGSYGPLATDRDGLIVPGPPARGERRAQPDGPRTTHHH